MTDHRFAPRPEEKTAQDAAAWFVRLRAVDGRKDRPAFARWRLTDQKHARTYREIEDVWSLAGEAAQDADIAALIEQTRPRQQKLADRRRLETGRWTRRAACMAAAVALIGAMTALLTSNAPFLSWAHITPTLYETAVGEQKDVTLADGSVIHLDTASQVAVALDSQRRDVRLMAGRARFTVAHDAQRPFVVRADDAGVTALGTVFDVQRSAAGVEVALLQGKVEVRRQQIDPKAGYVRLTPRQGVRIAPNGGALQVRALDGDEWGWTQGRLVFSGAPLSEVASAINRYSDRKIIIAPSEDKHRFRGEFKAGDIDGSALVLSTLYGFKTIKNANGDVQLMEN